VALLLKDRDGPSEAGSPPPGGGAPFVAPDFACHSCGGAMQAGQDWCLECGTAAPGRLGAKPGWRAAFTVVAVVLLLVSGATLAGYAALTSDAQRTAAAPSSGDGTPIPAAGSDAAVVPPAPVVQPGATGPGTTPPAVTPPPVTPPAGQQPVVPVQPPPPAQNTQVKPPAVTPPAATAPPPPAATGTNKTDTTGTDSTAAAAPKPEVAKLAEDSAATYDPGKRAGAEFGPAENAVDKSGATVWDVTVPADGKPIGAGLTVDLGKLYSLRAVKISTPTPGFEVEVYGAVSAAAKDLPEDILDKRWEHLTTIKSVVDDKLVSLLNKSKKQQQLLLFYITKPKDLMDPRVAIGKITVAGVPATDSTP
jgi:hypothetical protein